MKTMFRHIRLVVVISTILLLNGCALKAKVATPPDALTKDEILQVMSDKTTKVSFSKTGKKALFYFGPHGEFHKIENNWQENGRWRVNNRSLLCIKVEGQSSKCRMLKRDEFGISQYVLKKNGNHQREIIYSSFNDGVELFERITSASPPLEQLKQKAIISLFSNRTVKSKTVRKGRVSLTYYRPDGSLDLYRGGRLRTGVWRVTKKDRMCLKIGDSKEKCRIIVRQGESYSKYIVKKNGQHQRSINYLSFLPGRQI